MLHVKLQVSPSKPTPFIPELHDVISPLAGLDKLSHRTSSNDLLVITIASYWPAKFVATQQTLYEIVDTIMCNDHVQCLIDITTNCMAWAAYKAFG